MRIYAILEICMLSKSMLPSGTFVTYSYTLELVLLLHRGLGFLWKEHLHYCNLLSVIYFLQNLNPKTQKQLHPLLLYLLNLLTNTFSSSWVRQPFHIERYYNWSPALGSHQDTFLAPLPGSVALLVSWFGKETWKLFFTVYWFTLLWLLWVLKLWMPLF